MLCVTKIEASLIAVFGLNKKNCNDVKSSQMVVQIAREALSFFLKKELIQFDGLAGDNACQQRAWKIFELVKNSEFTMFATDLYLKIDKIYHSLLSGELKPSEEMFLSIPIPADLEFLLHSYVLSNSKKILLDENGYPLVYRTFPQLIADKYQMGTHAAAKLVKTCQRKLSKASIEYSQKLAAEYGCKTLQDRLSQKYIVLNAREVFCGPCYYEFYALILEPKRRSYSFVMKIYENPETHYSLYLKDMNEPKLIYENDPLPGVPHIVMEGRSFTKRAVVLEKFRVHGLDKILISFAAQHEQYPKKVKGVPIPEQDDLGYMENALFADQHGFSYNNPSVFVFRHIHN